MIFYKAIKYKILDFCLDSLCNAISRNFTKTGEHTLQLKDLQQGMRVSRIDFDGYTYIDCVIEFCNEIGDNTGLYYLYVACRDTTVPEDQRYAIIEKTGHYLFEMKLMEEECIIYA
jgi:hypothetical protein